ncbi:alpha-amylase [Candidatus Woesearchaeota archaeon]|nr:alpha-amylase [Candidatus Woesearchaeota archaeon]
MVSVCFYFQVHQPYRIKRYSVFNIGKDHNYFNDVTDTDLNNKKIIDKVAKKCYLPTNKLILDLIHRARGKFKVAYSITGSALDQFEEYAPSVLDSFKALADTGCVEFLNETHNHSLSSLYSKKEFKDQVSLHKRRIKKLFKCDTKVFRNTELLYNNDIAKQVKELGYEAMITEGADHILGWRSPNFVYKAKDVDLKLLLKNYKLSDDVAFRFSERSWKEWPLKSEKFARWVGAVNGNGNLVNLFMDYETFGEHQWEDTGIFKFLEQLPFEILKHPDNNFKTPSEAIKSYPVVGELDIPWVVSWADVERDASAWLGNQMQRSAIQELYMVEDAVKQSKDPQLLKDWRRMTTSDHFYYMCTKWFADGDVHKYFNPYDTPYDAFISFMNVMNDLKSRLEQGGENNEGVRIQV